MENINSNFKKDYRRGSRPVDWERPSWNISSCEGIDSQTSRSLLDIWWCYCELRWMTAPVRTNKLIPIWSPLKISQYQSTSLRELHFDLNILVENNVACEQWSHLFSYRISDETPRNAHSQDAHPIPIYFEQEQISTFPCPISTLWMRIPYKEFSSFLHYVI